MLDKNKNNVAEKFTTDTASSKYVLKDGENLVNSNSEFTNQHITFNNNFFPSSSSNGTDTVHEDQSEKVSNSDTTEADQTLILVESSRRRMNEGLPKNRKKDYKIIWRQKPVHARMSGNGAKERRTIDPPPILELMEIVGGELMPIIQENPFTFMRATLYSEDGTISLCELQRGMLKNKATLVGDLVEYSMILTDDLGRTGTFFVFRDLSIKTAGAYTLKFTLYDLESETEQGCLASKKTHIPQYQIISPVINILSPKDFPGIFESSDITKVFKNQGLKLTIRVRSLHPKKEGIQTT